MNCSKSKIRKKVIQEKGINITMKDIQNIAMSMRDTKSNSLSYAVKHLENNYSTYNSY